MQCPNCNAEIFKNDRFCGECGTDVSAITMNQQDSPHAAQPQPAQTEQTEPKAAPDVSNTGGGSSTYFKTVLSFVKNAFLKPGTMIGNGKIYAPSVTAGTVGLGIVIVSLLFFIMSRMLAGPYAEIPLSLLFNMLIGLAVMIAVYYGVTMLMNIMLLKNKITWQQIMHDFAVSTTIVLAFFIVAIAFTAITLVEIAVIFWVIGMLLFITAPIYIFLKYAGNNNVKFDSFYSLIIYFVFSAIIYYIIIRMAVASSMNMIEELLMY